ncbi:MAG: ATP-binding protein [Fibrobacter sp.]|nr:ATP-binding protein [Fibrobacter sp.]
MKRHVLDKMYAWNELKGRKPLILMGARQVGKTWLMEEFARRKYADNIVSVNFMKNERLRQRFESIDLDPKSLIEAISIETGRRIVPGHTLLLLDEIQESPRALTSLKFFNEDMPGLAIMAAGSLLGLAVSRKKRRDASSSQAKASFPVGKVTFLDVPPMTFEEFLLAVGEEAKCEALQKRDWKTIGLFHDSYCDLLRKYCFIGGMPEAVQAFATDGDFISVGDVHKTILRAYDEDFAKHTDGALLPKIRLLWNSIPAQLARENKKFVYTALRQGARAREYKVALEWLEDAGMIRMVHNVSTPQMPLAAYEEFGAFKLYAHDVGLVGAMAGLPPQILLEGDSLFTHFKGALTEQYVLEELVAQGISPCYWSPDNIMAEVEFVLQSGTTICPLEAKAGTNLRAKSLKSYINRFSPRKALRVSMSKRTSGAQIEDYPLYAIPEMLSELS